MRFERLKRLTFAVVVLTGRGEREGGWVSGWVRREWYFKIEPQRKPPSLNSIRSSFPTPA